MTLRPYLRPPTHHVPIDHYSAVHLATTRAREMAVRCGMEASWPDQAAAVASELASNLYKHATDGIVYLQPLPMGEGVEILAVDRGPGMAELQRCLTDGYTTTGTLGTGLGAVGRVATDFLIRTQVPEGTVASVRISAVGRTTAPGTGMVCLPADGEQECGDGCVVFETGGGLTAAVVDGLGHGEAAARATRSALQVFRDTSDQSLPDIMRSLHRSLRHTRGAAVGLIRLLAGGVEFCGVGNIRLCLLSVHHVQRRLDGRPGVVGWNLPSPQVQSAAMEPGQILLAHSDGIESRWSHDPSPFLLRLPAELLPAALAHRHRRSRDDASALSLTGLR
ncbi:SpoIIE family protein phosphatase [Streptomyces sp. NPDC002992]|uniref:SpoIIE family protein phosphatase n=1 Tax=Streptomyces sp. NPDC002992 TaxID=3154273 RepID=UPI0033AD45C5